jgi:hypothetical protein
MDAKGLGTVLVEGVMEKKTKVEQLRNVYTIMCRRG